MIIFVVCFVIYLVLVFALFLGYGKARARQERQRVARWHDDPLVRQRRADQGRGTAA